MTSTPSPALISRIRAALPGTRSTSTQMERSPTVGCSRSALSGAERLYSAHENLGGSLVCHNNSRIVPQKAQKFRPARPQRAKTRGVPLRYVEGLNDARTTLAGFFSILLVESYMGPQLVIVERCMTRAPDSRVMAFHVVNQSSDLRTTCS